MRNLQDSPRLEGAESVAANPEPSANLPQLPPTFPPGVDPETYRIETVSYLLRQAAYFSLFSVHNPNIPNVPLPMPGNPQQLIGMEVNEALHRFEVTGELPTPERGLQATNAVGQSVARVHIRWLTIPDNFYAAPDREPPPTPLNPTQSQRFTMLDGQFSFDDRDQSGFRGFGTGRTFPALEGGRPVLRLGAVVDILEGLGKFKDHQGNAVVNGFIIPPDVLGLNIMVRLIDASGQLTTYSALTPLEPIPTPDPTAVFMTFLAEQDPDHPTTLNRAPDGQILGSNVHEVLRLAYVSFDLGWSNQNIRSKTTTGPIVGRLSTTLYFNPLNQQTPGTATSPIPYHTKNGVFTFFDRDQCTIGTLKTDIIEGRAFKTELDGAPLPIFRMGGLGPLLEGTGQFSGAEGLLSMNAAISVFPRTLSNMYVLRIVDPNGKFHEVCRQAWS
jgi:hypothetical protein